ncbi:hypothetical protein [Paraburkholderia silvatlantica]|uniref:hypothetical protein n=1 Tax=Paraburkholderia silvatlantica TaxID=321895 RepID=UPI0037533376
MRVSVYNEGPNPIRMIIDGDNVSDSLPSPGENRVFDTRDAGTPQLRELGGPQTVRKCNGL